MKNLTDIISAVGSLEQKDLEALSSKILEMLKLSHDSTDVALNSEVPSCRKCSSTAVLKYGKDKNGKQRYKCKHCNTVFYPTSFSVVSKSRYSLSVWKQYIVLLLQGASLAKCAKECDISVQTAFTWRHKILHALQFDQSNRVLGGIIEIDDMFFPISYKGNHKNSKNFIMPRKPYKRGTDNTAATGGKVCVICAVERQGQSYAEVTGIGSVNVDKLERAFKNRLLSDSIALTDKAYDFKNYFATTPIELVQLAAHSNPRSQKSPPEIKGSFHIQNVNNFHRRFRQSMKNYNGVASKYLNHYVNLFVWIENYKKTSESSLTNLMLKSMSLNNSYFSHSSIVSLPSIPNVA